MITYVKQITPSTEDQHRLETLGNLKDLLFFDIETTGFDRIHSQIISITFMYNETETWEVKQLFAETSNDEVLLLNESLQLFNRKNIHITYNGNAFDIPFLNAKYNYYSISASLNKSKSYDLYRIAKNALSLENYKLKTIEKYLNIDRTDQISGLECIENYKTYLSTKDIQYANLILDHNYEDVLNLLALTKLIDFLKPEALHSFKVRYFSYQAEYIYFKEILSTKDYLEVHLWKYVDPLCPSQLTAFDKVSLYLVNGAQVTGEKDNTLVVRLPVYAKNLEGNQLLLFDIESFDTIQFQLSDEPFSQNILQYNDYYIYENLIRILITFIDKAFE